MRLSAVNARSLVVNRAAVAVSLIVQVSAVSTSLTCTVNAHDFPLPGAVSTRTIRFHQEPVAGQMSVRVLSLSLAARFPPVASKYVVADDE